MIVQGPSVGAFLQEAWSCYRSRVEPDAIDQTVNKYYPLLDRRSIADG
jgi:hypothetical protein